MRTACVFQKMLWQKPWMRSARAPASSLTRRWENPVSTNAQLARYGGEVYCFMSDEDVAATAKANGTTRATASMDKAAQLDKTLIFAIGNAPTALVRLYELIEEGKLNPALIIGVPVGFVNVVQSKEN